MSTIDADQVDIYDPDWYVTGDVGARPLISQYPELTCEVAMDDDAVLVDIDTPQALAGLGG